jgi:hypothetical protein
MWLVGSDIDPEWGWMGFRADLNAQSGIEKSLSLLETKLLSYLMTQCLLLRNAVQPLADTFHTRLYMFQKCLCHALKDIYCASTELSPPSGVNIAEPSKKFPVFYEIRWFINVFARALHWSLSWARLIQSTPPFSLRLRSILFLPFFLYDFQMGSFLQVLCTTFLSHMCYIPCPSRPPWLYSNTI